MKKDEVELIIISVTLNAACAINMKIYKNGTTCRVGVGGIPEIGFSVMSFMGDSRYFDPLIQNVSQDILDEPIDYNEPCPNGYLEYAIVFYGVSRNGESGERADWSKVVGTRFRTDLESNFTHPTRVVIDRLVTDAAELTNELYFDAIVQIVYEARSATLPSQTILSAPKTEEKLITDYGNYINQMLKSARNWDLHKYVKNKVYYVDDVAHRAFIVNKGGAFTINFIPQQSDEMEFGVLESTFTRAIL